VPLIPCSPAECPPAPTWLQDKGRAFRETFLSKMSLLLKGTVAAPADKFGETLADEHIRGGVPQRLAGCLVV
jgi:hypothetical protein